MKKLVIVVLAILVFSSVSGMVYAKTPSDKLARGLANVLGGEVLEIPKNIDMEWKASKNAAVGIVVGIFKGIAMGLGRLGSGLWDIFTFPAAVPADYEPLMEPDFVFDKE